MANYSFTIGIDASNIRSGGGLTHLSQLLTSAHPQTGTQVIVWGGKRTLAKLPERPWLTRKHIPSLDRPLLARLWWQNNELPKVLRNAGCNVLFAPGGIASAAVTVPTVVMSQNLLPFEPSEAARFKWSILTRLRYTLLRRAQVQSMRRAAGVIFLTEYARMTVLPFVNSLRGRVTVIPHGIEPRFFLNPRPVIERPSPFRVLYVSIINAYKHQEEVAQAAAELWATGVPINVEFVGPAFKPALRRLMLCLAKIDPKEAFIQYTGEIDFEALHTRYQQADAFLFASSCENLPNILLEAMAAGLPIACSDRGPMPEVLGEAGVYFDPEKPQSIGEALKQLHNSAELRHRLATNAHQRATAYSWEKCAFNTLEFLEEFRTSPSSSQRAH